MRGEIISKEFLIFSYKVRPYSLGITNCANYSES